MVRDRLEYAATHHLCFFVQNEGNIPLNMILYLGFPARLYYMNIHGRPETTVVFPSRPTEEQLPITSSDFAYGPINDDMHRLVYEGTRAAELELYSDITSDSDTENASVTSHEMALARNDMTAPEYEEVMDAAFEGRDQQVMGPSFPSYTEEQ
jgi:hypothetical protein